MLGIFLIHAYAASHFAQNYSLTQAQFDAGVKSYENVEYKGMGSKVLAIINASAAYSLGFSGQSITLGIADLPVNYAHSAFNKNSSFDILYNAPATTNLEEKDHGSHIGGIMVASKDGSGMHGVALAALILTAMAL